MLRASEYAAEKSRLSFYRDTNQKEIIFILEAGGLLHPFEIKKAAAPDRRAVRTYSVLRKAGVEVGTGGIICMTDRVFPVDEKNSMIPCNLL
jgi:predicted AAA+ superfamily ATPase